MLSTGDRLAKLESWPSGKATYCKYVAIVNHHDAQVRSLHSPPEPTLTGGIYHACQGSVS